jgi:hypothetical protein
LFFFHGLAEEFSNQNILCKLPLHSWVLGFKLYSVKVNQPYFKLLADMNVIFSGAIFGALVQSVFNFDKSKM